MFSFTLNDKDMNKRLAAFARQSPIALQKALEVAGLTFLRWSADGSPQSDSKPPIRTGFLRGSGSAFVGGKLIGSLDGYPNDLINRSNSADKNVLTVGYNAEYATRMHENFPVSGGGEHTRNDPGAGGKWLENHIAADKEALMNIIAHTFGKELGTL